MTRNLLVFMGETRAGLLSCEIRSSSFEYDRDYLALADATPVSLSMPLRAGAFPPEIVDPFLWGLLPDNPETLQRWAVLASPQADEHNPFSLLQHYGRDCAGAIQFLDPERIDEFTAAAPTQWLTEVQIGNQLRSLRADPNSWVFGNDGGRFSLAGAQSKFALLRGKGKWGRPRGATPTTHIVKPGIQEYRANALNEHICLTIAARLGLPAARTSIETFDGEQAIVVERYDRVRSGSEITRIHQEDFCQALSVMPSQKYQDEGGPGLLQLAQLIRDAQRKDRADATITRLLSAVAFNWLIAAPDGHSKNYSLLLRGPQVSLAPLYDIASLAPYSKYGPETAKIAHSVDGHYLLKDIGAAEWVRQAQTLGLDGREFVQSVRLLAETIPQAIDYACSTPEVRAIDAQFAGELRAALRDRAAAARDSLVATP